MTTTTTRSRYCYQWLSLPPTFELPSLTNSPGDQESDPDEDEDNEDEEFVEEDEETSRRYLANVLC